MTTLAINKKATLSPTAQDVLGDLELPIDVGGLPGNNLDYLSEAANNYPEAVSLLEELEALTTCKRTADRIRTFMKEKGLWS